MLFSTNAAIVCAVRISGTGHRAAFFDYIHLYTPRLPTVACRFFPSVYYLSTSKVAIAVLGNFAFAVALCTYFLLTKVPSHSCLYMTKHMLGSFQLYCLLCTVPPNL